jgi:hypothetical protein
MSDQKRYICDSCLNMTREELVDILNFLHREHIDKKMFSQNSDGIKIDLNRISDDIIDKLYVYIQYKANKC